MDTNSTEISYMLLPMFSGATCPISSSNVTQHPYKPKGFERRLLRAKRKLLKAGIKEEKIDELF